MRLIENLNLGDKSFWYTYKTKTYEQEWNKFHTHQGLEFLYIHQGNGYIVIDQKVHLVKPNTLICFQPYQLHRIYMSASEQYPYIRTMLVFEPVFVDQFIKPFPTLYSTFKYLIKGKLKQQLFDMSNSNKVPELLFDFNQRLKSVNSHSSREELVLFLISLLQLLRDNIPLASNENSAPKRELRHVEKVLDWVEKHYNEEFVLDRLALDLHLSSYHISHLFREEMGCTITDFITIKRLKEACLLLSSTDLSIQTIGNQIGLRSNAYFSHVFKKNIGMTPKQYRSSSNSFFQSSNE